MKNSLSKKGLSLSEAQSISNLCNQHAAEIDRIFNQVTPSHKTVKIDGVDYVTEQGVSLPENVKDVLLKKCSLHALQAFLMENIKAKNEMLKDIDKRRFVFDEEEPTYPELEDVKLEPAVDIVWGFEQLSLDEVNE